MFKILISAFIAMGLSAATSMANEVPQIRYQPDPDTPIGARNPAAPAQSAEYDFLIGDWDVVIEYRPPNREAMTYSAKWHNVWAVDGFIVMQEWRGPYASGMEVRQYNPQLGHWEGFNFYAGGGTPKAATARFSDGQMVVTVPGGSDQRGTFINRETYFNIETDRFEMEAHRSYDGGESWEDGTYSMVVTRTE